MPLARTSVHFEVATVDVLLADYKPTMNFARKKIFPLCLSSDTLPFPISYKAVLFRGFIFGFCV